MARPRVFISSTYYDLKHLRSSLENFVESLGFDAILSEKGKIAYLPDIPLDESCYREVSSSDILVLIVGGRYGSEASAGKTGDHRSFYDRYNSITKREYGAAVQREIPIYILIERAVYAEYETYLANKANATVTYAHVDSVNIFELIEDILAQPRNNPLQQFDRYAEIEAWLRAQWAGLFRELLQRVQTQTQLATLQAQVNQLAELNQTLKIYLEEVVTRVAPDESRSLIQTETKRLEDARERAVMEAHPFARYLRNKYKVPFDKLRPSFQAGSYDEFVRRISRAVEPNVREASTAFLNENRDVIEEEVDDLRRLLGLAPFPARKSTKKPAE